MIAMLETPNEEEQKGYLLIKKNFFRNIYILLHWYYKGQHELSMPARYLSNVDVSCILSTVHKQCRKIRNDFLI